MEARAKRNTTRALRQLARLQPSTARVRRDDQDIDVPIADVRTGDLVIVRPGERIPGRRRRQGRPRRRRRIDADRRIDPGREEARRSRHRRDRSTRSGSLEIEATSLGASSVLARIVTLMKEAQGSQAPIQRLADRISAVFVPAVVSIAVATFAAVDGRPGRAVVRLRADRGGGRPDHRLPVRDGPGRADGGHGGERPRRQRRRADQGRRAARAAGRRRHRGLRQDRHADRGQARSWSTRSSSAGSRRRSLHLVAAVEAQSEHPLAKAIVVACAGGRRPLTRSRTFRRVAGRGVRRDRRRPPRDRRHAGAARATPASTRRALGRDGRGVDGTGADRRAGRDRRQGGRRVRDRRHAARQCRRGRAVAEAARPARS